MSKTNDNARAMMLQASIMDNDPIIFHVGKKKFKVRRLTNWVSGRIDKLIANSQFVQSVDDKDTNQIITTMIANRRVIPKCASYMILKHPFKVILFHWIYWRYLNLFYRQDEFAEILHYLYSGEEAQFFFQNMASLQMNNTLPIEMTKADMKNIVQKLASGASTTQSSVSMGK